MQKFILIVVSLFIMASCSTSLGSNSTNSTTFITNYIVSTNSSTNIVGSEWTCVRTGASFGPRSYHTSVVFNSNMWVIGGYSSSVSGIWYSLDGIIWDCATSGFIANRYGHTSVIFKNKIWTIGGNSGSSSNDVWYSSDGTNWLCATNSASFSPRYFHTSVVFNNAIWVIGGQISGSIISNDVWFSTNGTNWFQATSVAPFSPRCAHASVVFNNAMWVIGGWSWPYVPGNYANDVWYSTNGTNWVCAKASGTFPARASFAIVVFDNKMWIIGGGDDIWNSSDGTNWVCVKLVGAFPTRQGNTSVVFDNKMWVIGGGNGNLGANWDGLSDVWYSQ